MQKFVLTQRHGTSNQEFSPFVRRAESNQEGTRYVYDSRRR